MSFEHLKEDFHMSTPGMWDFVVADNAERPHCQVVCDSGDRVLAELGCVDRQDQANAAFMAGAHTLMPAIIDAVNALHSIRAARDHMAAHCEYPAECGIAADQLFDDWAADLAAAAIERLANPNGIERIDGPQALDVAKTDRPRG